MHRCVRLRPVAILLVAAAWTGHSQVTTINGGYTVSVTTCGVVGNKVADDTVALNNCIAALPEYQTLEIPAGMRIKITGTINVHGKHGFRLQGLTSMYGGPSADTDAPSIYWFGPANGKMFDLDNVGPFYIDGITIFASPEFGAAGGAAIGFNVNQALSLGVTTTNGIFERVGVYGTGQNPNFVGIQFSALGRSNVEHMVVRDSTIACSYNTATYTGTGIAIGPSANAKKHLYTNNAITNCASGIYVAAGSADIVHNEFNQNKVHITTGVPSDPMSIRDNDSENGSQFFVGMLASGSGLFSNRIASVSPPSGVGAVQFTGGAAVLFEGNSFDQGNFIPVSGQGAPYGAPAMFSRGNTYPNITQTVAGFMTFGYQFISELDSYGNGLSTIVTKGTSMATPPTPGLGLLNYDFPSQKWQVSENGTGYRDLVPVVRPTDPGCSYIGRVWFNTAAATTVEKHCLAVAGTLTWVTK